MSPRLRQRGTRKTALGFVAAASLGLVGVSLGVPSGCGQTEVAQDETASASPVIDVAHSTKALVIDPAIPTPAYGAYLNLSLGGDTAAFQDSSGLVKGTAADTATYPATGNPLTHNPNNSSYVEGRLYYMSLFRLANFVSGVEANLPDGTPSARWKADWAASVTDPDAPTVPTTDGPCGDVVGTPADLTRRLRCLDTLKRFMKWYNISEQNPGETPQHWRDRVQGTAYYNKIFLGFGRLLICGQQRPFPEVNNTDPASWIAPAGETRGAMGCIVTNFGQTSSDKDNALADAVANVRPKNTVCIYYDPQLADQHRVNFYNYDYAGRLQTDAALDEMGRRMVPNICMSCHGGSYDKSLKLAQEAKFLPVDLNNVDWPTSPSRAAQEAPFKFINGLAFNIKYPDGTAVNGNNFNPVLSQRQRNFLRAEYNFTGEVFTPPGDSLPFGDPNFNMVGWGANTTFQQSAEPYCEACHAAHTGAATGYKAQVTSTLATFKSRKVSVLDRLCHQGGGTPMPPVQPGMALVHSESVLGAPSHRTVLLALAYAGSTPPECTTNAIFPGMGPTTANSSRGTAGKPKSCLEKDAAGNMTVGSDLFCGQANSGRMCSRMTEDPATLPPSLEADYGRCVEQCVVGSTDRLCTGWMKCVPNGAFGICQPCGGIGQQQCAGTTADVKCAGGWNSCPGANGMCEVCAFKRGDADNSGAVDVNDAQAILQYLYMGATDAVRCNEAANANDDATLDLSDAISILVYKYQHGPAPAAPGATTCGADPAGSPNFLGCNEYSRKWCY